MKIGYALNPESGRIISKSTAKYRKLVKLGLISDEEEPQKGQLTAKKVQKVQLTAKEEPEEVSGYQLTVEESEEEPQKEPEYNEIQLKTKLAAISSKMIKKNLAKVIKAQTLSEADMEIMLKKMLFKRLCIEPEPEKVAKTKKASKTTRTKFKLVEPSDSEESDSD
jgi:hypothetical protein